MSDLSERVEQYREEWAWRDATDDRVAGYGHHMSQMLARLPRDGQTDDMRKSIEAMLDHLAAAEARAARLAEVVGDAIPSLPVMTNGKTWADCDWWAGKAEHDPPQHPTTLAEAEALTWARCWAYIDEHDLPAEVCHHIWPLVSAALHADRATLASPASVPESSVAGAESAEEPSCACGALLLATTNSERHDRGLHGAERCIGGLPPRWKAAGPGERLS